MVATEKDMKENKVKSKMEKFMTLCTFSQEEESFDYNVVVQNFQSFYISRENITLLRYKFLTFKQKQVQCFDEFITQFKKLPTNCERGELRNALIKNIVVIGVTVILSLRERKLREPNLTLEKAIALGQSAEQTKI